MTNEYLEELLRFALHLRPKAYFLVTKQGLQIIEWGYKESDYDRRVNLIYRKYLKEVRRPSMKHLNYEQLKELNRRCKEEQE